jgi:hypothetical protein
MATTRELNDTWSGTLNVRLAILKWETHAVPGIGEDAQDAINRAASTRPLVFFAWRAPTDTKITP